MIIRKATLEDAVLIADYLLLAMEAIVYKFMSVEDQAKANALMLYFVTKDNNQYSYQNCWVAEVDEKVVAAANVYDGARLVALRKPFIEYINTHFNHHIHPEDETGAGEYYIDTIGVDLAAQGKGIGTAILQFLIKHYVHQQGITLGLLVDEENKGAKRLYVKLGFKSVGKKVLLGQNLEHLQVSK